MVYIIFLFILVTYYCIGLLITHDLIEDKIIHPLNTFEKIMTSAFWLPMLIVCGLYSVVYRLLRFSKKIFIKWDD